MIRVIDLLLGSVRLLPSAGPEDDPFVTDDVLLEAQVLGVLNVVGAGVAGVLLDLRMAMQLDVGSVGLLVVRGNVRVSVDAISVGEPPVALPVLSSVANHDSDGIRVRLEMYPAGGIGVSGKEAQFFIMDIPGLPDAPPDYTDPEWSWLSPEIPQWQSACNVLAVSESVPEAELFSN